MAHVEKDILGLTLPSWKHRQWLEGKIDNVPLGAINAHKVPTWQLIEILVDNTSNPELKSRVESIMQEVVINEAPPTPGAVDMDQEEAEPGDVMWANEVYSGDDDFELPHFVPLQEKNHEVPDDLYETPCLQQRRRLREKQRCLLSRFPFTLMVLVLKNLKH